LRCRVDGDREVGVVKIKRDEGQQLMRLGPSRQLAQAGLGLGPFRVLNKGIARGD
jgi:hypothetical protein